MHRLKIILTSLILSVMVLVAPLCQVAAAPSAQDTYGDWQELTTNSFAIIFPSDYALLAQILLNNYGETLDAEYARFAATFDAQLSLPVTIRIYPQETDYLELNVLAPQLGPGAMHSHIGSREIALIGANIIANLPRWQIEGLNAFRYELAILFTRQVSEKKAPPGLLAAVGTYAQDPKETLGILDQSSLLPSGMTLESLPLTQKWETLWESEDTSLDLLQLLQATSIVAYLVDAYGWPTLVQYLKNLPTASAYASALESVYKSTFSHLQEQWQAYFPIFTGDRWQFDVLYNYDLSRYAQLVQAGGYSAAVAGLNEAVQLLEKLNNQPAALEQAGKLLAQAKLGQSAAALALQSRQAFLGGDYAQSIEQADQAEQAYHQLGDTRRLDELAVYRSRAAEILSLRNQAEKLSKGLSPLDAEAGSIIQLADVGARLGSLGDGEGERLVESTLLSLAAVRKHLQSMLSAVGVILAALLLVWRILLVHRKEPVEARL
jgi:hypothetical protein